jgi:hypothetical protein
VWTVAKGKVKKFQQYTETKQFADAVARGRAIEAV